MFADPFAPILDEIVDLAEHSDEAHLRSRVGVEQYRRLYRLVRRHVSRGSAVLDWGAGNGHFSYFLVRAGYRAVAFSVDDAIAMPIPEDGFSRVHGSPDEPVALPFEDASFDAVVSVGVLEHVHEVGGDAAASLAELARVLRPGGALLLYHLPNRGSWIEALVRATGDRFQHEVLYSTDQVRDLIRGAGLRWTEHGRYGLLPRNSMGSAPRPLRRSRWLARVWNGADRAGGRIAGAICQNHYLVAHKDPGEG